MGKHFFDWFVVTVVIRILSPYFIGPMASAALDQKQYRASIHWFRKGLRLHDNPALVEACRKSTRVYPVFVIDPWFAKPDIVGINRYSFLLQSLENLDNNLRAAGSRLFVVRGKPDEEIPALVEKWNVDLVTFESDTEPYARKRDSTISTKLREKGVKVSTFSSHTIFDTEQYIAASKGSPPNTYQGFCKLFLSLGKPGQPVETITRDVIPPLTENELEMSGCEVPTLEEMGYSGEVSDKFPGGETEALRRMEETVTQRPKWVCDFEKPETSPNSIEPSTTVLSPYIKFGCLSARTFYHELDRIYKDRPHAQPPVSLHGQLLWREFFYFSSVVTPNFDKMIGNPRCKQIPWGNDPRMYDAFKQARTGYPYIDAIMTQLKTEGWIHHLARHSLACFFTRGDLWQHWEKGAEIFDLYLLDSDWALNNANWQWLSCSNFFYQYFRCYSPIAFGKKTDKNGDYIRKYIPQLAKYPAKFIYEPWKAPLSVQRECGCVIGDGPGCGYPAPVVDHDIVSAENMAKMKEAYANQPGSAGDGNGDGGDGEGESKKKRPASSSSSSSSSTSGSKRKK